MAEEEKPEEPAEKPEEKEESEDSSELSLIERTEKAVKELRTENDRTEAIAKRIEKANSDRMLGGRTRIGQEIVTDEKAEKKLKAKEFFKGTMIEGAIERHG